MCCKRKIRLCSKDAAARSGRGEAGGGGGGGRGGAERGRQPTPRHVLCNSAPTERSCAHGNEQLKEGLAHNFAAYRFFLDTPWTQMWLRAEESAGSSVLTKKVGIAVCGFLSCLMLT